MKEDADGSKELWRRILFNERFVDVWFTVGGTNILNSTNSSCIVSPDPGAPGGPTSAANYPQKPIRTDVDAHSGSDNSHHTSRRQIVDDQNAAESLTLSHNTGADPDLTGSEMTDVGSDLDDSSPNRRVSSSRLGTQPISIPSTAGNSSDMRMVVGTYPPGGTHAQTLQDMLFGPNESQHTLIDMPPYFEDPLRSHNAQIPQFGTRVDTYSPPPPPSPPQPGTAGTGIPPPVPPHRVSPAVKGSLDQTDLDGHDPPSLFMHCEVDTNGKKIDKSTGKTGGNMCWRFGAHKLILAAASPVFEAMFFGPVAEMNARNAQTTSEYHIPDIHPKVSQQFPWMVLL
ncbi:unnamed protein product [Echinostoma caproni]|uniref:BTB domain-containing protein n=1 Tax=Echinostoma caproni TaxID=27848 RepID=A0A183AX02_9TREM|nr:unnamed protein product [Echinostoma caproni]